MTRDRDDTRAADRTVVDRGRAHDARTVAGGVNDTVVDLEPRVPDATVIVADDATPPADGTLFVGDDAARPAHGTIVVSDDRPRAPSRAAAPRAARKAWRTVFAAVVVLAVVVLCASLGKLLTRRDDAETIAPQPLHSRAECALEPNGGGGGTLILACHVTNPGPRAALVRIEPWLRDASQPIARDEARIEPGTTVTRSFRVAATAADVGVPCGCEAIGAATEGF